MIQVRTRFIAPLNEIATVRYSISERRENEKERAKYGRAKETKRIASQVGKRRERLNKLGAHVGSPDNCVLLDYIDFRGVSEQIHIFHIGIQVSISIHCYLVSAFNSFDSAALHESPKVR